MQTNGPLALNVQERITRQGAILRVGIPGGGGAQWVDIHVSEMELALWLHQVARARQQHNLEVRMARILLRPTGPEEGEPAEDSAAEDESAEKEKSGE